MVLLCLIFVGVLPTSISADAAQTASGNTPDAGTISDTRVANNMVVDGKEYFNDTKGSSVIYSVMPDTEYNIRARIPTSIRLSSSVAYFSSYPSLGSRCSTYLTNYTRHGDYIIYNFTTSSDTSFVILSFRFYGTYDDYDDIIDLTKSFSNDIGDTLGLYAPLSDRSTAKLAFGLSTPRQLDLSLSGFGGIGDYHFTVDVVYNNGIIENLATDVSAGYYSFSLPAFDNDDRVRVTISDRFTSITNDILLDQSEISVPDVSIISSPEVDIDYIPETSISVDNGVANIIVDSLSVIPSEITALLIPVVLFSLIGWWLHK